MYRWQRNIRFASDDLKKQGFLFIERDEKSRTTVYKFWKLTERGIKFYEFAKNRYRVEDEFSSGKFTVDNMERLIQEFETQKRG